MRNARCLPVSAPSRCSREPPRQFRSLGCARVWAALRATMPLSSGAPVYAVSPSFGRVSGAWVRAMSALLQLADRCERAAGSDCGLDEMIFARIAGWSYPLVGAAVYDCGEKGHPAFTSSLDAAMRLVPEGLRLMLTEWDDEKHLRPRGPWQAVLSRPGCDTSFDAMKGYRCEHAATPALALCAAALRARAAQEQSS